MTTEKMIEEETTVEGIEEVAISREEQRAFDRDREVYNLNQELMTVRGKLKESQSDLEGYKTLYRNAEDSRRTLEEKIKAMKVIIQIL